MNETAAEQQVEVEIPSASSGPSTMFFVIGIAINLALLAAFGLWAVRQWKKNNRENS